ncbi:hypothetical protein [Arthrobacter sp.]|uniref:hypothetical protein n=1 Tax=Arthrobacter sp. TaxID=1667 RepID=UPI0026E0A7E1|nr:hypothetical protein [Arthrobacter sp.]MDO5754470.1 hypothetical protein [Arthrobacter sp.]
MYVAFIVPALLLAISGCAENPQSGVADPALLHTDSQVSAIASASAASTAVATPRPWHPQRSYSADQLQEILEVVAAENNVSSSQIFSDAMLQSLMAGAGSLVEQSALPGQGINPASCSQLAQPGAPNLLDADTPKAFLTFLSPNGVTTIAVEVASFADEASAQAVVAKNRDALDVCKNFTIDAAMDIGPVSVALHGLGTVDRAPFEIDADDAVTSKYALTMTSTTTGVSNTNPTTDPETQVHGLSTYARVGSLLVIAFASQEDGAMPDSLELQKITGETISTALSPTTSTPQTTKQTFYPVGP